MLTGSGICVRSVAKIVQTFQTNHLPHRHGAKVRKFQVGSIQQLTYLCGASRGDSVSDDDGRRYKHGRTSSTSIGADRPFRGIQTSNSHKGTATAGHHIIRTMATLNRSDTSSNKDARARLTALRLYRILQRLCGRLIPTAEGTIFLQNDISASDWGHYQIHDNVDDGDIVTVDETEELIRLFLALSGADPVSGISKENEWYDELMGLLPKVADKNTYPGTHWTTPAELRGAIRFAFRSSSSLSSLTPLELQALALRAIQMIEEQAKLWNQSSVSNTSNGLVRVTATSRCLGKVSPVSMNASYSQPIPKYRFAYRIRIENISSSTTVQLLGRYWHIAEEHDNHDDDDENSPEPIEVDAPYTGAVGQLPVLQPGQVFEYVSGTDLTTPRGEMMGHLYMAKVPPQTRSAKSGDNVTAVTNQESKESSPPSLDDAVPDGDDSNRTTLFQAPVKPFRLQWFEK